MLLRQMLLPLHLKRCVPSVDRNKAVQYDISNFGVPGQMWMKALGTFSSLLMLMKCNLDADFAGLSSTQIFLEGAGLGSWMQACHRPFIQAL